MPRSSTSCGNSISLGQLDFFLVGQKCASFVAYLFPSATARSSTRQHLPLYIAYVLRRSGFDTMVVIAAMVLLQRYRELVDNVVYDTDVYRLFFASFIVASKAMDSPYKLQFWFVIGGGIFSQEDLVDITQDFCRSLDWDIHIDADILLRFVSILHNDAGLPGDQHTLDEPPPSYTEIHRDIKIIDSPDFICIFE